MMDYAEKIAAWIGSHLWLIAWIAGWTAALGVTQTFKMIIPLHWSDDTAKRVWLLVAVISGFSMTLLVWPIDTAHGVAYAALNGVSAPQAYTLLRAVVAWKFPELADKLSWSTVKSNRMSG